MSDNSLTPEPKVKKVMKKAKINKADNQKFKAKYFEFYDDVKTHNNGPYDW